MVDFHQIVSNLRDCVRQEDGDCEAVVRELIKLPQFHGAEIEDGFFVTRDGDIVHDHFWIRMPDGSILDPTQNQFGQGGFGDIVAFKPDDPRTRHYFPMHGKTNMPMGVVNFADEVKDQIKQSNRSATFSQIVRKKEAYGASPVGDAAAQQRFDIPSYLTTGGQEDAYPAEEPDGEYKPEEFEDLIRSYMTEEFVDWRESSDTKAKGTFIIDKIEYQIYLVLWFYDEKVPVWRMVIERSDPYTDIKSLGTPHIIKYAEIVAKLVRNFIDSEGRIRLILHVTKGRRFDHLLKFLKKMAPEGYTVDSARRGEVVFSPQAVTEALTKPPEELPQDYRATEDSATWTIDGVKWIAAFQGKNFSINAQTHGRGLSKQELIKQALHGFTIAGQFLLDAIRSGKAPDPIVFIGATPAHDKIYERVLPKIAELVGWNLKRKTGLYGQHGMKAFVLDAPEQKVKEVDHPEFMPSSDHTRYDPWYDMGTQPDERQPGYNTGHPEP